MSIGNADLCKAIVAAWGTYALDAQFQTYWDASLRDKFPALNDAEAEASHPHPYCVFTVDKPNVNARMSYGSTIGGRHIRDVPVEFTIYARDPGGAESAKVIAAKMAEEIMKVFGGHPTTANRIDGYSLDNGNILIFQFDADYGMRIDIENYSWHVNYLARLDVPVA